MSFFKGPESHSLKVLLLVLVIAGAGYFAVTNSNMSGDQTGKVFQSKKNMLENAGPQHRKIIIWGGTGECTVVFTDGSYIDGTSEYNADGTFKGCRDGDGNLWQPGMPGVVDIDYGGPKTQEALNTMLE